MRAALLHLFIIIINIIAEKSYKKTKLKVFSAPFKVLREGQLISSNSWYYNKVGSQQSKKWISGGTTYFLRTETHFKMFTAQDHIFTFILAKHRVTGCCTDVELLGTVD